MTTAIQTTDLSPFAAGNPDKKGERGAIMVMGVFLACSMIAAMWYMMGIGDAILWRDRQQEAADSVAYTSAAIHARGMNFISMINIIMLCIVGVYLIASILRSVLDMILYISGDDTDPQCFPFYPFALEYTQGHGAISALDTILSFFDTGDNVPRYGKQACNGPGLQYYIMHILSGLTEYTIDNSAGRDLAIACASCGWTCPACFIPKCYFSTHPMHDIADFIGPIYNKVEQFIVFWDKAMRFIMPKFHSVEVATAVLTPWVGAGFSAWSGAQYKDGPSQEPATKIMHKGMAFSPSMFRKMKKPDKIRRLKDNLNWIPCATKTDCGNGCGPTLCNTNNAVSRSGPRKSGTSGAGAECCAKATDPGCTLAGTCSKHGGVNPDQSGLYEEVTIDNNNDYRIGLPVQGDNMNELCQKSFSFLGDLISGMMDPTVNSTPGGGGTSTNGATKGRSGGGSGGGKSFSVGGLIDSLFAKAGGWFKAAYCSYDPPFSAAHSCSSCRPFGLGDTKPYEDVFPGENGSWDSCQSGCGSGDTCTTTKVCKSQKCPGNANDFWAINDGDECPFAGEIGHTIPLLYGKSDLHGGNGPMKVVPYSPNGEDYMQVYGIVINDNYNPLKGEYGTGNTQTAWSKIRLGAGPDGWNKASNTDDNSGIVAGDGALDTIASVLVGGNGNGPWFYLSEAEFYHDCESEWTANDCNGGDHATYRLNWRTRLRRVRRPVYMKDLTDKIPGWVTKIANYLSTNQWAINQFATNYAGIDLGTLFNYAELLSELGTSDPNGLMKPIYH